MGNVRDVASAILLLTASCTPADLSEMKEGVDTKYIGSIACKSWNVREALSAEDREKLNWTLGFLSGLAASKHENYLKGLSPEKIWSMVVKKCAAKPFNSLGTVAYEIERDLLAQRR